MTLYKDQMKNKDFNIKKVRKGRKKKTIRYCLDILTFDIEVTSAWMTPEGLIGYEPGHDADYWNKMEKYSLPYIWQFSFNDEVYYGREIKDFLKVLQDLPGKNMYIIWIHNLAYEFQTCLINLMTVMKTFARTPHSPMYAIFEEFPNIRFQCSYVLTNLSLRSWGDELGIEKLVGDLDYTKVRTPRTELTETEMGYCERDCVIVYEGIKDHLKRYEDVWDIPMTSTGKVRRPVKEIVTNDYKYMKHIKKLVPQSVKEYELFQAAFAGGYTHGNRKYLGKTVRLSDQVPFMGHADIASSYPTEMMKKLPYNKWVYFGHELPDPKTFENRAYIIRLHLTKVRCKKWNTYISASKCRGTKIIEDNGRVLAAEELYLTVTHLDYQTIIESYEIKGVCESLATYACHKRYLPTIFVNFMLKLYEDKCSLKHVPGAEERYKIAKQYINALYGMSVCHVIMSDVLFENNDWIVKDLDYDKMEYILNKKRRWFDKSYFVNYSSGVFITAGARRSLWSCILHGDMDNRLLYCDTDSLFYIGEEDFTWYNNKVDEELRKACEYHGFDFKRTRPKDKHGVEHPLGHMELENEDQTLEAFKSLGAKKYIEQRDRRLYMTVSGVNKDAVSVFDSIDQFEDGFVFDKDYEDMHKNELHYLSNMQPVTWPDGYHSDLKYGINMRPTGYKLSTPKIYDVFDNFLERAINPTAQEIIDRRGKRRKE